ncbi:MAG: hypothetical protein J6B85_05985 [Lachnospiraceae bacterium]|nr:hypothetical protein [Lachnospiraceae bacterium]
MRIYADDTFYQESYLEGRQPVIRTGFSFYVREASRILDQYTFGRLNELDEVPDDVKLCCCELAELGYRQDERERQTEGGKTSEKVGTYSVTYASEQTAEQETASGIRCILAKWLGNTGLLYQGV